MNLPTSCLASLLLSLSACAGAEADTRSGRASVVDGDTIQIAGERIRIWGVDAPEARQTCTRGSETWRCGQQAALALSDWIGRRTTICHEQDRDRYDRSVATCAVAGEDMGEWLVSQGWAVEYTQFSDGRYRSAEASARAAGVGVHAGPFIAPWEWRRQQRSAPAPQVSPRDCNIKGNISRNGDRIYHTPGMRSYENTTINEADGERWFCNETEAEAAGWRARGAEISSPPADSIVHTIEEQIGNFDSTLSPIRS